ncbi:hypothetical protein [Dactylosporangium sp. NPDC051484]|uniref:hypothetical protein n=1 Tax=Dactylosporangium sp. NPDC051484 TaxID=3154942 RepID=UPI00344B3994
MSDRRVGIFWPLGAPFYVLAGLAVFGLTFATVFQMLSWPYQEWAGTSALFHQRLDLTGPLVAFLGAYLGGRLTPPTRPFALPKFPRDRGQFLAQNLVPLAAVVTVGYLLALAPVLAMTLRSATYGTLDLAVAATGLLALNAFLILGWLIGLITRSAFIAPAAFALALVTTFAGYSGDTFAAVAPVLHIPPRLGFHEAPTLVIFRIAFIVVLSVIALTAADGILSHRRFDRRWPAPSRALIWLVPLAFLTVGVANKPALFVEDASTPTVCGAVAGMKVCVHKGHETQLAALVGAIEPIVAVVGTEGFPFRQVYDRALKLPSLSADEATTFYYDLSPTLDIVSSRSEFVFIAAGGNACLSTFGLNINNDQTRTMRMLESRLEGDHSTGQAGRFASMSDAELKVWIASHRTQVSQCAIMSDVAS